VVLANGVISLTALDHHAGYRGRQYHFQRSARARLSGQHSKHFCRLHVQSNALLSSLFSCLLHAGALEFSVSLPCSGGEYHSVAYMSDINSLYRSQTQNTGQGLSGGVSGRGGKLGRCSRSIGHIEGSVILRSPLGPLVDELVTQIVRYLLGFTAARAVVHVVGDNGPPNANAEAFAQGRIQILIRDLHASPSVCDELPALDLAYE
jgi:hypothetical protein